MLMLGCKNNSSLRFDGERNGAILANGELVKLRRPVLFVGIIQDLLFSKHGERNF